MPMRRGARGSREEWISRRRRMREWGRRMVSGSNLMKLERGGIQGGVGHRGVGEAGMLT
jgi:hypothetical protein